MTTTTYSITCTDSDTPPAWMDLCVTATPRNQDSGRCAWTATTTQPEAMETALDADPMVLGYREIAMTTYATESQLKSIRHGAINNDTREIMRTGVTLTHEQAADLGEMRIDWLRSRLDLRIETTDSDVVCTPRVTD